MLEKLNRRDFAYKVFEDPFSETELWPIFEAVLGDHGVVGEGAVTPAPQGVAKAVKPSAAPLSAPVPAGPNQIFSQYGLSARQRAEDRDVDLGAFFHRFSEMD
ncbi:hypothetical protein [Sphingobium sp.]|uniref:hypothetical protein n=1 Tax=Sphingobium sp. TaxID=1912891 RepID=UPI0035C6EDE9